MKILVHDYAGHAFPASLSRALARRGHEVRHAFASDLQTPRGSLSAQPGDAPSLQFCEIAMDPNYPRYKYSFLRRRRMEIRYGQEVARFVQQWRPEVVISGNTPTETQDPLVRATRAVGGRFYYWVQDFYSLAVDRLVREKLPVLGPLVGAWYRHLDKRHFTHSAGIVPITADFVPILQREFGVPAHKTHVVPNWAVLDELPQRPRHNAWAKAHGLEEAFTFLYSGTIGLKHDPGLILELARTFADDERVRVVVISEGIGADWLRRESAAAQLRNLTVMPYQPIERLPDVLASGDVLLAILGEDAGVFSVPSKTLSYLCAGRPLLLSVPQANLASRMVVQAHAGMVVAPGDREGWLAAARHLREAPVEREAMGRDARAYAEKHFAMEDIATAFEQIFAPAAAMGKKAAA